MAHFRDETQKKLNQFSYVAGVQLNIEGFYKVDFWVNENVITLESYINEKKYGITSLVKALIDLGGRFDDDLAEIYPEEWKQLKKWHEYKWYNRPKK